MEFLFFWQLLGIPLPCWKSRKQDVGLPCTALKSRKKTAVLSRCRAGRPAAHIRSRNKRLLRTKCRMHFFRAGQRFVPTQTSWARSDGMVLEEFKWFREILEEFVREKYYFGWKTKWMPSLRASERTMWPATIHTGMWTVDSWISSLPWELGQCVIMSVFSS